MTKNVLIFYQIVFKKISTSDYTIFAGAAKELPHRIKYITFWTHFGSENNNKTQNVLVILW